MALSKREKIKARIPEAIQPGTEELLTTQQMKEIVFGERMMHCLVNFTWRKAYDGAFEDLSRR